MRINNFYRGNINLKRANTPQSFNIDQGLEIAKCKADPIYFAENYIKVITLDEGFTSIELYDYQKKIIESFKNEKRTIVATSRQVGKTTTAVCLILHYILFNRDVKVALLANKADSAREVLERIQLAYEALPSWLQQGVAEFNKSKIILENKSQVIAAATSSSAIRGKTVNVLYIDETAFVENWDTFYASVYPTISSGKDTKILFTSTPNGLNHFHKFWEDAHKEKDTGEWNGYNPIHVRWQEVPGRDQKWADDQLAALSFDRQKFAQEFEVEFQGSSGTLISGDKLKSLVSRIPLQEHEGIKQYVRPEKGHTYVLIADVSRGKGLDYSAFQIIDITKLPHQQVCVFRSNMINTVDYADIIFRLANAYNECSILVENNDIGAEVPNILHLDYEYENIIYTESAGRAGKRVSSGFGKGSERGIRTSVAVKAVGCSMLKMLIEQDKLIINDRDTIEELSTFSRKGKSFEAESGKHDDLVMPLVLFAWMTNQQFFKELANEDIMAALREKNLEQLNDEITPFGFIDDGQVDLVDPFGPYF